MRVLLDECIDWRLSRDIRWPRGKDRPSDGLGDDQEGELLALAERNFDVFVTVDRNLSFQQNLTSYSIAVVVLRAKSNRLADLKPLVPELLRAITSAQAGNTLIIGS